MRNLKYKSWAIEYDDVSTLQVYKDLVSGLEECVCENCKNFLSARERVYPEDFKRMLAQLGIDYQKEREISYLRRIKPGWHLYSGWFHFVGRVREAHANAGDHMCGLVPDLEKFAWSFTMKHDLVPKAFGQSPVVQLDWTGAVPWVMDLPEPL